MATTYSPEEPKMQSRLLRLLQSWRSELLGLLRRRSVSRSTLAPSYVSSPSYEAKKNRNDAEEESQLPPAPRSLLENRLVCEIPLLDRTRNLRGGTFEDRPLAALYRIYEHVVLDQHLAIRNEIEAFWYHADWLVCDVPDPKDPDPERYACLACIPALLCLAFNKRIDLGLPRDAPPIFTQDMLAGWRAEERRREEEPPWVELVPALPTVLAIPHWDDGKRDFIPLDTFKNSSREFAKKNILIWQPHIHFA